MVPNKAGKLSEHSKNQPPGGSTPTNSGYGTCGIECNLCRQQQTPAETAEALAAPIQLWSRMTGSTSHVARDLILEEAVTLSTRALPNPWVCVRMRSFLESNG